MDVTKEELLDALRRAESQLDMGGRTDYQRDRAIIKSVLSKAEHVFAQGHGDGGVEWCKCRRHITDPIHIKPKSRRWVVEFPLYAVVDPSEEFTALVKVIREVKLITREDLEVAVRRLSNSYLVGSIRQILRELGIEVSE